MFEFKLWKKLLSVAVCTLIFGLDVYAADNQPNILVIVTDDQGYGDISAFKHSADDINTPNIDRIALGGMRFTQAYATAPICSPARAGIQMGSHQARAGMFGYTGKVIEKLGAGNTMASQLKNAGYRTVKIGKTHYGALMNRNHTNDAPVRNHIEFPLNHGFESFYGFIDTTKNYGRNKEADADEFGGWETSKAGYIGKFWRDGQRNVSMTGYTTDLFTDEAIAQLKKQDDDRPFYIQLEYNSVHHPIWDIPDEIMTKYGISQADAPDFWDPSKESYRTWNVRENWIGSSPESKFQNLKDPILRKFYLALTEHLDNNIGRLLDQLKAQGLDKNTLVVFTSDHGGSHNVGANNGPLTGHKYQLAEGGVRSPLAFMWKNEIMSGGISDAQVSHMDIMATALAAAGVIDTPEKMDGKDLLPIMKNEAQQDHRTLYWKNFTETAMRHGNWKIRIITSDIKWPNFLAKAGTYLYDLDVDPGEQNNLVSAQPDLTSKLQGMLADWRDSGYAAGPADKMATLVRNGSFEINKGSGTSVKHWGIEPTGSSAGQMTVKVSALKSKEGIWELNTADNNMQIFQTTDHIIGAHDQLKLSFSVNIASQKRPKDKIIHQATALRGFTGQLYYLDDAGTKIDIDGWALSQLADDDTNAWQMALNSFTAKKDAAYLGKQIGVRFFGSGALGFRAVDDISLTVVNIP